MATPALTPKALLESLHEHLTAQTALLPSLHAQLGLSPTALSTELEQLRTILAQAVEAQIASRQKEVEEWVEKCEELEKECIKLVKALGSHAKGLASVGELRKQQVLPKRHELLTSHHDKLFNLYQAKYDQFTLLSNRLTALANTLGSGFFPPDVLSTRSSIADETRQDVSPERFTKLEKELVRGKSEVTKRLAQFSSTINHIVYLYNDLGISLPTAAVVPGEEDRKQDPRELIIARHAVRMDEAEDEGLSVEALGVEGVDPTVDLMEWAEALKISLEDEKTKREYNIQSMYDQLEVLWKRLGIEEAEVDKFIEENSGTAMWNVQAYEGELDRMLELKRQSMSTFIVNARAEIQAIWDDLMLGDDERQQFMPFFDDEHTEELLTRHEEEILRLKEERRSKGAILNSVRRYFDICEEEKELAAAASDQSRLLGRGPRDPGRLLREEKMRKRVKKEKPRLEQELLVAAPIWEQENGRAFLVQGLRLVDALQETVDSEANKENSKKRPRAGSVIPSRATTPAPVPSRKHTVTPSLSANGPNKRQRTATGSTVQSGSHPASAGSHRISTTTPTYGTSSGRAPFGPRNGQDNVPPVPTLPSSKAKELGFPHASNGKGTPSSLPRPISPMKGYGPGGIGLGVPGGFGSRPGQERILSNASVSSTFSESGSWNGAAGGRRRSRRESFKPRQSIDAFSFSMGGNKARGGAHWNGSHEDVLEEENEDF